MAADHLQPRVEGIFLPQSRLEGESGREIRQSHQRPGVLEEENEESQHETGAVGERHRLLGLEAERTRLLGRSEVAEPDRNPVLQDECVRLSHQDRADMRELRQIAAGAQRADLRHPGVDAAVEQIDQRLHERRADPGMARRQAVGPDEDRRSHRLLGERGADRRGVRIDVALLELLDSGGGDLAILEDADAGVEAVDRRARAAGGEPFPLHDRPHTGTLLDRRARDRRERPLSALASRHAHHLLAIEGESIQLNRTARHRLHSFSSDPQDGRG